MRVKYPYLSEQFADIEEYISDIRGLVASGEFTLGPYVEKFEGEFAAYLGMKHVISTNNGTDALILALKSLKIGAGDEVITVCNSFYATAGAIVACGATPVFVDCDQRYQIDPERIESAITKKTRAILPVHWTGASPDMDALLTIAKRYQLEIVEDACPAVGARVGDKLAGTFGKVNAFSMHPLKPLNVWGDGGMIATDDNKTAEWLRCYRNHGMTDRDHIAMWGVNARLQPVQAVVASRQLKIIDQIVETRCANARALDKGLARLTGHVELPKRIDANREAFQLYIACFKQRDQLLKFLVENGVEAKVHYPVPLHLQAPGLALGYKAGDFPVAEQQAGEIITLPSHQHLGENEMNYTVEVITDFYRRHAG